VSVRGRSGLIRSREEDDLPSHAGAAYRAADFIFDVDVRVPDPDGTIDRLMSVFGRAPAGRAIAGRYVIEADPAREGSHRLVSDDQHVPDFSSLGSIVDWIVGDVTRRGVASLGRGPTLHAGAVSWDGMGVILPGISGAGKSTLVAGLVATGAAYLSDEVADIDASDVVVHPFPRPMVLDPDSVAAIHGLRERLPAAGEAFRLLEYHVTPDDLGSRTATAAVPIRLVVEPHYEPHAATDVEPLSRAAVLAMLATHVFGRVDAIEDALERLRGVALTAPGYRLRGSDLDAMVAEVRRLSTAGA
jgi:hypothetical protein